MVVMIKLGMSYLVFCFWEKMNEGRGMGKKSCGTGGGTKRRSGALWQQHEDIYSGI